MLTSPRGITFVLQSVLFRIVPTALEVSLVCGILVCRVMSIHCQLSHPATIDIQVWMGLRCYHGPDDGRVFMVYGSHNFEEVNIAIVSASVDLLTLNANLRIQYRRAVNQADNKAATVSIDSLINYEAVKVHHQPPFVRRSILYDGNSLRTSITKSTRSHSMTSILPHTRNLRSRLRHRSLT